VFTLSRLERVVSGPGWITALEAEPHVVSGLEHAPQQSQRTPRRARRKHDGHEECHSTEKNFVFIVFPS